MRLERIIAIIMLLLEREKVSGEELAELFEVSVRTIYRDVQAINQAGIPILTVPGVGGGISIMEQYKVEKRIFTVKDITAMLMGLGFISNTLSGDEIAATLVKIQSFVPEERMRDISLKASQVVFDLDSWMGNRHLRPLLEICRAGLDQQRVLSFSYIDRKGKRSDRRVEPLRLLLKDNNWYLQAFCLEREDFRTFKVSRMDQAVLLEDRFLQRQIPVSFLNFAVDGDMELTKALLLVEESAVDRLLDYCSWEDIRRKDEKSFYVNYSFMEDDFGYGIMLSLGMKCICLEPPHVKEELARRLNEMLENYK